MNQQTRTTTGSQAAHRRRRFFIPAIIFTVVFIIALSFGMASVIPERYELVPGDSAPEDIIATRAIEDTAQTKTLREAARSKTAAVYDIDRKLAQNMIASAEDALDALDELVVCATQIAIDKGQAQMSGAGLAVTGPIQIEDWSRVLDEQELDALRAMAPVQLADDEIFALLSCEPAELVRLKDAVLPKITLALSNGLLSKDVEETVRVGKNELNATTLAPELKSIGDKIFTRYIVATMVEDAPATERARERAAEEVEPVMIQKGSVIIGKGQVLTATQEGLLKELGLIRPAAVDVASGVGVGLYALLILLVFAGYVVIYQPQLARSPKNLIMSGLLLALVITGNFVLAQISPRFNLALYATLLIALMVKRRAALAANMVLALLAALLVPGVTLFEHEPFAVLISTLVSGGICVCFTKKTMSRSALMVAGVAASVAAALTSASIDLMKGLDAIALLINAGWAAGSCLAATVLVIGTMPLWESVFDVSTSARLIELSSANHPLLKRLMAEAPGTYHHSMMVASLSEAAAEEIGANQLLARVGSYYHDVGKLKRPAYFGENQHGENPLDTLSPLDAAALIIAHAKDGAALCQRHKLPSRVVEIVAEHHGSTLVAYFYHRASKDKEGAANQKNFRYPTGRPSTKESAIVMLADSVEAAVRSLQEQTYENVADMITKVIKGKLDDDQLALAPITLSELSQVERSFLKTFAGLFHERVEYPSMGDAK